MNKVILVGRITKNAEVQRGNSIFCRFNIAVDLRFRKEGDEQTVDFINCVGFCKTAEFLEKYGARERSLFWKEDCRQEDMRMMQVQQSIQWT